MCAMWFFPKKINNLSNINFSNFNNNNLTSCNDAAIINISNTDTATIELSNILADTAACMPMFASLLSATLSIKQKQQHQQPIQTNLLIDALKNQTTTKTITTLNNNKLYLDKLACNQSWQTLPLLSSPSLSPNLKSPTLNLQNTTSTKQSLKINSNKNLKNSTIQKKKFTTEYRKQKNQINKLNNYHFCSNNNNINNNKKVNQQNKIQKHVLTEAITKNQLKNDCSGKIFSDISSSKMSITSTMPSLVTVKSLNLPKPLSPSSNDILKSKMFLIDRLLPCSYTPNITISEIPSTSKNKKLSLTFKKKTSSSLSSPISFSNSQSPITDESSSTNSSIINKDSIALSTISIESIKNAVAEAAATFIGIPVNFFYYFNKFIYKIFY